jgi:hypothetical protein
MNYLQLIAKNRRFFGDFTGQLAPGVYFHLSLCVGGGKYECHLMLGAVLLVWQLGYVGFCREEQFKSDLEPSNL